MTKTNNSHFIVFDNDTNMHLISLDTYSMEFETLEEACEVAKVWKKASGHSISIKCIYTVEAEWFTL